MPPRVGFWPRAMALLVDLVLVVVLWMITAQLILTWLRPATFEESERIATIIFYGLLAVYALTELPLAATLGKIVLGLRIARADGRPADWWTRILRWNTRTYPFVLVVVYELTSQAIWGWLASIGFLFVAIGCLQAASEWKQAWHDEWAHTAVFRRRDVVGVPPRR